MYYFYVELIFLTICDFGNNSYRLMASAFSDSLMASGGGVVPPPPKISGTTKGMTMKFLPDVGIY